MVKGRSWWQCLTVFICCTVVFLQAGAQQPRAIRQLNHPDIDAWPRQPVPYANFDWKQRFLDFDQYIFNWNKKSTFPTIKLDDPL